MEYNKYMTEHVKPNKYFYVRGGILKKRSKYCKVENCFKISSYGIDKIERCLNHRLKDMTNVRRKHILCKIHDISHGKNTKCKLCKKPNKYCNENNCYASASFNFKIDDRPIKCKKHKENNMINVKRKYIVNNNNTKITYKKGYICDNNKKGWSIKNNKKSKNIEIVKNNEENNINEEYQYDPDPKFTEDELKQIYADLDDDYFKVKDAVSTRKLEWDQLKLFPYIEWIRDYYGSKYAKKQIHDNGFFSLEDGLTTKQYENKMVTKWITIKDIENKIKKIEKKSKKIRINRIKAAKILNDEIQLNKEKFNNLDWFEYKNYIIPNWHSKLSFIDKLKDINHWHNFLIKNLLKRDICKKFGLDDYQIHKDVVFYFKRVKYTVESLFSPFSLTFIRYYNGNIENYKKNIN